MKQLLYAIGVLTVLGGVLLWAKRPVSAPEPQPAQQPAGSAIQTGEPTASAVASAPDALPESHPTPGPTHSKRFRSRASAPARADNPVLDPAQAIGALVDAATPYAQKEQTWKQLADAGKLDVAISSLEQQVAANPNSAGALAALGHAYLLKAGATADYNERASLGMKIDAAFDAALKLEPTNWEARFNKAVSMSYWPAFLGKDKDVAEQFLALVQQQETQTPEPQFAQTYLKLGEQYQKLGYGEYARDISRRGAGLFPDNPALDKLAASPSQSQP